MKMHSPLFTSSLCLLFSSGFAGLAAQNGQQGPASALAVGLSLDTSSGGEDTMLIKPPLRQTSPPTAWTSQQFAAYKPDFRPTAMFGNLADYIEVDAHSSGNDLFPELKIEGIVASGEVNLSNRWMGLSISVGNQARGLPGSLIRARVDLTSSSRNTPGADLISYYFNDSSGLNSNLIGRTLLSQSSEQIGFSGNEDLDAFDYGIGVHLYGGSLSQTRMSLLFPHQNDYYFSLSSECIDDVNSHSLNGFFATGKLASAAAIYHMSWMGASWSQPTEYVDPIDLGLDSSDNLDALAVNGSFASGNNSATDRLVIFSTQWRAGHSQLKVYQKKKDSMTSLNKEYVVDLMDSSTNGSVTVSSKLGIDSNDSTDDIDGVCIEEPESNALGHMYGISIPTVPVPAVPMGISVTVSESLEVDGTGPRLLVQTSGWGAASSSGGCVYFWVSPSNFTSWLPVGVQLVGAGVEVVDLDLDLTLFTSGQPLFVFASYADVDGALATSLVSELLVKY